MRSSHPGNAPKRSAAPVMRPSVSSKAARSAVVTRALKDPRKDLVSVTVVVREDDTLWDISQRTGISLDNLLKANKNSAVIFPGQELDVYLTLAEQQKLRHNQRLVTTAVSLPEKEEAAAFLRGDHEADRKSTHRKASSSTPTVKDTKAAASKAAAEEKAQAQEGPRWTRAPPITAAARKEPPALAPAAAASAAAPSAAVVAVPQGPRDYFASVSTSNKTGSGKEGSVGASSATASVAPAPLLDTDQLVRAMRENAGRVALGVGGAILAAGLVKTFLEAKADIDSGKFKGGLADVSIDSILSERRAERRARQLAKEEAQIRATLARKFEDYRARMLREGKPAPPPLDARALDNLVRQTFEARRRDEEIARLSSSLDKGQEAAGKEGGWIFGRKKEAEGVKEAETKEALDVESVEVGQKTQVVQLAPPKEADKTEAPSDAPASSDKDSQAVPPPLPSVTANGIRTETEPVPERVTFPIPSTSGRRSPAVVDQEALIATLPFVCIVRVLYPNGEMGLLTVDIAVSDDHPSDVRIVMFEDRDEARIASLLAQDWYQDQIADARFEAKDPKDARALALEYGIGVLIIRKGQVNFRPGLGMDEFTTKVMGLAATGKL